MRSLKRLLARLRNSATRRADEARLREELELHLALQTDENLRAGLPLPEARRQAVLKLGGMEATKQDYRAEQRLMWIENLLQDLRFGLRILRKSPSFTLAALLTLGVAIGANAVVFGALNALILRPLNVPDARSLYAVSRVSRENESYPSYLDLRDRNRSFDALAASAFSQVGLDSGEGPSRVWGYETSDNYFDVLGIHPCLGRFFHASDSHGPNSAPYVVLSYAYWHGQFHEDPGVVGRTVRLNQHPFTVIGVAPPGFRGLFAFFSPDVFLPIANQGRVDARDLLNARSDRWLDGVIGHLKTGVTPAQATADLNSIGSYLETTYPEDESQVSFRVGHPDLSSLFGGAIRDFLLGLTLLAGLILLAACANLGSLFAARAADRSREIALRLALGADRRRILRQLLTEALLISVGGGAAGLWGSLLLLRWLSAWRPFAEFPVNVPVSPDAHVYGLALLLAVASGFLFGAVPVRQVLRTDPYAILKSGSRSTGGRRAPIRDLLLGVQVAICALLVTSSLVAVRGLLRSLHANLGFEPRHAMLVYADLGMAGYTDDRLPEMHERMIHVLAAIPGVTSVGLVGEYPPLHMGWADSKVFADQTSDLTPSHAAADSIMYSVSPEYFRAAGTPLVSGRPFTSHDDKLAPAVAVVNREFARRLFGSATRAIGGYYRMPNGTRIQVVGIVQDGRYTANLAEDRKPAMFLPVLQSPSSDVWLVVRSDQDPQPLAAAIRNELRDLDAGLPAFIQTWGEEMNGALFAPRVAALVLGVLGAMGALLSIAGVFGMAAYSVSRRRRELGIRMALGAQRKEVLRAALGRAVELLAFGSAAGLLLGILASRVLASIVYQATPRDPVVLAGVVLAMALLGLLATWVPAQRALAIDPAMLLRDE
jgi:predicted permease